jgi:hypothetical protein
VLLEDHGIQGRVRGDPRAFIEEIRRAAVADGAVAVHWLAGPGQAGSQAFKNIQRKWPTLLHELGRTVESIREYIKALDALDGI